MAAALLSPTPLFFYTHVKRLGGGGGAYPTALVAHDTLPPKPSQPPHSKKRTPHDDTSVAGREFDKVTPSNEYLAADISIVLFTDIWVTPTGDASGLWGGASQPAQIALKWVSVRLFVCVFGVFL